MIGWLSENAGMTGLLFFFGVFVVIGVWSYRPKAKETLESHKFIPLEGDEK
jgi:cbb3-type cytochrome oxidase subunit 3